MKFFTVHLFDVAIQYVWELFGRVHNGVGALFRVTAYTEGASGLLRGDGYSLGGGPWMSSTKVEHLLLLCLDDTDQPNTHDNHTRYSNLQRHPPHPVTSDSSWGHV